MSDASINELQHKSKVDSESYITIQGWMLTDLKLSGNDLLVYAIIYGFSKDGKSEFYGGRQYLADWCNSTVRGIQKNIDNLEKLGLIIQTSNVAGVGVKYKAIKKDNIELNISSEQSSPVENISSEQSSLVPVNKVHGSGEQSSLNNIDNTLELKDSNSIILKNNMAEPLQENSSELNIQERPKRKVYLNDDFSSKAYSSDKEEKQKKKNLSLFDKCALAVDEYTTDEELRKALKNYLAVRLRIKGDKALKGINQWKASLNILSTLKSDKIKVVNKAAERNWASFFEVEDRYKDNTYTKPNRAIFGETEEMTNKRPNEVEGGGFSGLIF